MTKKRMDYEVPTVELLVVRFEENILSGANAFHQGGAGHYDNDDTNEMGDF